MEDDQVTAASVVKSEYAQLLERAGGSALKAFELLEAQERSLQDKPKPVTKDARIAAARTVIETKDPDALAEVRKAMTDLVSMIKKSKDLDPANFSDSDALSLMKRWVAFDKADVMLKAEREYIREKVFDVIAHREAAKGNPDPENTNGSIEVPSLGKKFDKYGCGYKATKVDEAYLRALIGDDKAWEKFCVKTVVPRQVIEAHTEMTFSLEKYMEAAGSKPELLETLSAALEIGDAKSPSFTVRDL